MGNTRKREVFQAGRGLAGYKAEEWAKVSMWMLRMSKRCGVQKGMLQEKPDAC